MKKYSTISIAISVITLICTLYQDYRLAKMFQLADGKTQALFSFIEIGQLYIKEYIGVSAFIGLLFGILSIVKKENRNYVKFAILINVIAVMLLFSRFWRFLI
ncbi:hypothetical protein [Flavobacterium denitrificans]|uniref:hypothetical protein n=1 Tax=Flavobacterium denitrificans TaxID=281361 RepID=UPI00047D430A|nr:hypothetical protein [Flavobacterium denitrificans]